MSSNNDCSFSPEQVKKILHRAARLSVERGEDWRLSQAQLMAIAEEANIPLWAIDEAIAQLPFAQELNDLSFESDPIPDYVDIEHLLRDVTSVLIAGACVVLVWSLIGQVHNALEHGLTWITSTILSYYAPAFTGVGSSSTLLAIREFCRISGEIAFKISYVVNQFNFTIICAGMLIFLTNALISLVLHKTTFPYESNILKFVWATRYGIFINLALTAISAVLLGLSNCG